MIDTGPKLTAAREKLGMTKTELAATLRYKGNNGRQTVRRMEDGTCPVSGPVQVAVEAMLKGYQA